ncbi:PLP-dependent aminotransferase family protein [Ruminococcaceae bacterium OttesenSCG-928-D13]|nr:PLP-dependent aminotransferase family protein [Ruminococcaceae bacterium OttesenSCG-928-D13]
MTMRLAKRMQQVEDSAFLTALDKAETVEGMISFAAGMPAPELFPVEAIIRSNTKTLEDEARYALQYGPVEGHPLLNTILTKRMADKNVAGTEENILVTSGSQQALDFVGKVFIDEGDAVIVENPTYLGALSAFNPYMPRYVAVEMDEEGMIIEELERALRENPNAKFIYTIPDFQNPTGRQLSLERRKKMLELSNKYNVPIVEDAPYTDLCFEGEQLPPLKALDDKGLVIYLGTLSKIFCPAFRIGWIFAEKELISRFVAIKVGADLQTSLLLQRQSANFLKGFDMASHIQKIRDLYRSRRDVMLRAIEAYMPEDVTYTRPKGGLFIWVGFPPDITGEGLVETFIEEKVLAIPGETFFTSPPGRCYFRLNYSFMPEKEIDEGIRRLANVIKAMR